MPDRPHGVTIVFAVIAFFTSMISIGISGIGLYVSHRALSLNEAASRAVVAPLSVTLLEDWKWNPGPKAAQDAIRVQMVVENSGKTIATSIRMQLWPNLCNESPLVDEGSDQIPQKKCFAPADTVRRLDDLGPGVRKPYVINIDVTDHSSAPLWSPGPVNNINLSPVFEYSDSNGHYHEQPCFAAGANSAGIFEKGPIPPCAMLDRLRPPNP